MGRLHRVLAIPDTHAPFHDKLALGLVMDVAKEFKPDTLVILGDFFDFYSVSRHDKNPLRDYKLFYDELKEGRAVLDDVIDTVNAKKVVFLQGNHERRLETYIAANCPKLAGIFNSMEILGLPNKVIYRPYGQENYYKIGNLVFTHGARAGESPAASMVKKHRCSVLFGHCHRIQEFHITNLHGNDFVGLSPGWLGDERKAAEYILDVSDWSKGFALTHHKPNGSFYHQLVQIHGKGVRRDCFFNGVEFCR